MQTIINIIQLISDNRFWLMPLVLVCALGVLGIVLKNVFVDIQEEMDECQL